MSEDNDFESFEVNEEKLESLKKDVKSEDFSVIEGEDEWTEDEREEEVEEEEVEEKEETKEEEVEEEEKEKSEAEVIKEDLLTRLDGKTKYRIKGKEYDLADIDAEQILENVSKGGRFFERMEEVAASEKTRNEEFQKKEQYLQRNAEILYQQLQQTGKVEPKEEPLPPQLEVQEFDSEGDKALKGIIATQHKEMQEIKTSLQQQSSSGNARNLEYEIDSTVKEFPLASKEEIVAILATPEYAHVSVRDAAKASHEHYSGDEYWGKVLEARPEKLRQLKEDAVKEYLAKKGEKSKTRIPRRRSSSTASSKLSTKKEKPVRTFDDIEARHGEIARNLEGMDDDGF